MNLKRFNLSLLRFRKLLRTMKIGKKYFIVQLVSSLLISALGGFSVILLIPLARGVIEGDFEFLNTIFGFGYLIDKFPQLFSSNFYIFLTIGFMIIFATALSLIIGYFSSIYTASYLAKARSNMRKYLFSRYLSFGKQFYDRTNVGGELSKSLQVSNKMVRFINIINNFLKSFFSLIVNLILMIVISIKFTIYAGVLFILLYFSIRKIVNKIKEISISMTNKEIDIGKKIQDTFLSIPLVKAYSKEKQEKEKLRILSDGLVGLQISRKRKHLLVKPIQESISLIGMLFFILIAAFVFSKGDSMVISSTLIFFYLLKNAVDNFTKLSKTKLKFAKISGWTQKYEELLADKGKFYEKGGDKKFAGLNKNIKFNNLSFSYDEGRRVLDNVSFTIGKGKITAIVGHTGAGKTTLINLIIRFYNCQPSSILLDNKDINEFDIKSLRNNMALVSQDAIILNDTIRNNINYGLKKKVSENTLKNITKKARLYDFIKSLPQGFDTQVGGRGIKLSGGERQRVAIARALIRDVDILFLDEATSSLDSKTEKLIQEAINEVVKNRTVIVIAHRLSTIKNADKIIVLEKGKVVEEGTLKNLLRKKGKFYEAWNAQKFN